MSINVPGILSSPISRLSDETDSSSDRLCAESLFLVEIPQDELEDQTPTHYISKKVLWDQISSSVKSYLDISELEARLQNITDIFKVPSVLVETTQQSPNQMYIISAVGESSRAQVTEISAYNFKNAIVDIADSIVFPKLSATHTPWVEKNQLTSEGGTSETLVASQKLIGDISSQVGGNYLEWDQVVSELGPDENLVASQKLVNSIFNAANGNYLKKSEVATDIGDSEVYAASQKLVHDISSTISSNFIDKSRVKEVIGNTPSDVASIALLNSISSYISTNFLKKGHNSQYLRDPEDIATRLGDATDMGASQKLVKSLSSAMSALFSNGEIGDIFYLSSTMTCLRQKMAVTDAQVCETPKDLEEVLGSNFSFKKVYTQWTKNAFYGKNFYNYKPYEISSVNGSGITGWEYDDSKNTVKQLSNANDYNFYVSPVGYADYDFSARLYSTSSDDDRIGLVAGYTLDSDAKPVMMWFERVQGSYYKAKTSQFLNTNHSKWLFQAVKQNTGKLMDVQDFHLSGTAFIPPITQFPISDYYPDYANEPVSSLVSSWGTEGEGYWHNFEGGTIIKIRKRGNMISAWTTKFGDLSTAKPRDDVPTEISTNVINRFVPQLIDLDQDSKFVIDLEDYPELSAFRDKPVSIGFINQSQANSMYEILEFKTPTTIVDGFMNSVSTYNFDTDEYEKVENTLPAAFVGPGRLAKNIFTGKLFYVTQTGFVKLYEPSLPVLHRILITQNGNRLVLENGNNHIGA